MNRAQLQAWGYPDYTRGEEIMNVVTHTIGSILGVVTFGMCLAKSCTQGDAVDIFCSCVFGLSMIILYTVSAVYHSLPRNMCKLVMQVLDHCTIYLLIAGTYTPLVLCALRPAYPVLGWGLFAVQWGLAISGTILTAIDMKRYLTFSYICYIGAGWSIILFLPQVLTVINAAGFYIILAGGIAYTIGAVLYSFGSRVRWSHSVFHIFVLIGSLLHLIGIYQYVL